MPIRPGTEGAALLRQEWDSEIRTAPTEEMVIAQDFSSPQGVDKNQLKNQLNIRIVPAVTVTTLASTDTGSGINFNTQTTTTVAATPVFTYGAVEIPQHLVSKMSSADQAQTKAAYRKLIMAALNEGIDQRAGILAASCSEQVGAPSNFDKSLLLHAKSRLRTRAKDHVKDGTTVHLKYHPSQIEHLLAISEIANANTRGGKDNPNVSGVIVEAWGLTLAESGNVYVNAGVTYNFMFVSPGFVLGYNMQPKMYEPQEFDLVTKMIAAQESGVVEVFDTDGVAVRTP